MVMRRTSYYGAGFWTALILLTAFPLASAHGPACASADVPGPKPSVNAENCYHLAMHVVAPALDAVVYQCVWLAENSYLPTDRCPVIFEVPPPWPLT